MLKFFRVLGLLEALSFILLLFIAMPLKYMAGMPEATKIIGMLHGLLFVAYVMFAAQVAWEFDLRKRFVLQAFAAAVLPFGPFIFERKILKNVGLRSGES